MTHYVLQWKAQSAGDYTASYETADATETSHTVAGLTGGNFYDIRVVAYNSVGASDPSGAIRVVAATLPTAPSQPSLVSQSSTQISIEWAEPSTGGSPITSYAVYVKSSSDATYSLAGETSPSTLTFSKSDIMAAQYGASFDFAVTATTAAGSSGQSTALTVKAVDAPSTPATPTKVSQDRTEIQLGWTAPASDGYSAIQGYRIYWNNGGGAPLITDSPAIDIDNGATYSHTFTGLTPGERYVFAVSAYNEVFESGRSETIEIVAATQPAKPDPITRSSAGPTEIGIQWTAPDDGDNAI